MTHSWALANPAIIKTVLFVLVFFTVHVISKCYHLENHKFLLDMGDYQTLARSGNSIRSNVPCVHFWSKTLASHFFHFWPLVGNTKNFRSEFHGTTFDTKYNVTVQFWSKIVRFRSEHVWILFTYIFLTTIENHKILVFLVKNTGRPTWLH